MSLLECLHLAQADGNVGGHFDSSCRFISTTFPDFLHRGVSQGKLAALHPVRCLGQSCAHRPNPFNFISLKGRSSSIRRGFTEGSVANPNFAMWTAQEHERLQPGLTLPESKSQTLEQGNPATQGELEQSFLGVQGMQTASPFEWAQILQLENKNIRDLASVIACPRLLQTSLELPLVPDTVFGAGGAGWEGALCWLRSLDPAEVDAWFEGKRRTRLGYHFADCVEYILRCSPFFRPQGLHVSQQVFLRKDNDVIPSEAWLSASPGESGGSQGRGAFTRANEEGVWGGANGADENDTDAESCTAMGGLFDESKAAGLQCEERVSGTENGSGGREWKAVKQRQQRKFEGQGGIEAGVVGGIQSGERVRTKSGESGRRESGEMGGTDLGERAETQSGERGGMRSGEKGGPAFGERKGDWYPMGRRKSRLAERKAAKKKGKTITVGEFDILFLRSDGSNTQEKSVSEEGVGTKSATLQGRQKESGESARKRLTGQSQAAVSSVTHEANAVGVEHWELSVKFLLYIGPTEKLLASIANSGVAPLPESKRVLAPEGKSVGVLAESEPSGNRNGDLVEKLETREETDGRTDGHRGSISAGGTGNGTEPYGKERLPGSVGPSTSLEEDLLFYFVGPHAGERLSDRRDRIAKQLHLSDDPKAKQVLANLFGKPCKSDIHSSEGEASSSPGVDTGGRSHIAEEPSAHVSVNATGGLTVTSSVDAKGAVADEACSEAHEIDHENGVPSISAERGGSRNLDNVMVLPRAFIKGYLFYEHELWKLLAGRGQSQLGLGEDRAQEGPMDGPKLSNRRSALQTSNRSSILVRIENPLASDAASNGASSAPDSSSDGFDGVLAMTTAAERFGAAPKNPVLDAATSCFETSSGTSDFAARASDSAWAAADANLGDKDANPGVADVNPVVPDAFPLAKDAPTKGRPSVPEKASLNPGHWIGWWTRDVRNLGDPLFHGSMWYIIPKMEWLSPVIIRTSEKAVFEGTCNGPSRVADIVTKPTSGRSPLSNKCTSTALTWEERSAAERYLNAHMESESLVESTSTSTVGGSTYSGRSETETPLVDTDLEALQRVGALSGEPSGSRRVENEAHLLTSEELLSQIETLQAVAERCKVPRRGRVLVAELRWADPEVERDRSDGVSVSEDAGKGAKRGAWKEVSRGFVVESTWPVTGELPIMFP